MKSTDQDDVTRRAREADVSSATVEAAPLTAEDLPRIIAEALDAADKRREERAVLQAATQNLEAMRANYAAQSEVLERLKTVDRPVVNALADATRALLDRIDRKLAEAIKGNAAMIDESMRQAHAVLDAQDQAPPSRLALLPGQAMLAKHGKRR